MKNATLLINGMFHNDKGWEKWETFFNEQGYTRLTPSTSDYGDDPTEIRNGLLPESDPFQYEEFIGRQHSTDTESIGDMVGNSSSKWVFLRSANSEGQTED